MRIHADPDPQPWFRLTKNSQLHWVLFRPAHVLQLQILLKNSSNTHNHGQK